MCLWLFNTSSRTKRVDVSGRKVTIYPVESHLFARLYRSCPSSHSIRYPGEMAQFQGVRVRYVASFRHIRYDNRCFEKEGVDFLEVANRLIWTMGFR